MFTSKDSTESDGWNTTLHAWSPSLILKHTELLKGRSWVERNCSPADRTSHCLCAEKKGADEQFSVYVCACVGSTDCSWYVAKVDNSRLLPLLWKLLVMVISCDRKERDAIILVASAHRNSPRPCLFMLVAIFKATHSGIPRNEFA